MKKILAMLLALIISIGVFAACAKDAETPAPDNTDDPGTSEDPATPGTSEDPATPGTSEDPDKTEDPTTPDEPKNENIIEAVIDMTDTWTLVIKNVGAAAEERTGIRAPAGKVQAATYNKAGTRRMKVFEFDYASLGFEGYAWEYLGATVEIDVSDESNPKIVNKPAKSTWCCKVTELSFPTTSTVKMPDGTILDMPMQYGIHRQNYLLNEGGKYIPAWNDKNILSSTSHFYLNEELHSGWHVFVKCELYNQTMGVPVSVNLADPITD